MIKLGNNNHFDIFDIKSVQNKFNLNKSILSLMYRWKLDAFKTKYVKNIVCLCKNKITREHIVTCPKLKQLIPMLKYYSAQAIFETPALTYNFFVSLERTPLGKYL